MRLQLEVEAKTSPKHVLYFSAFLLQRGFCNIWGAEMIFVKYGNCPHKYNAMFGTATIGLEEV